MSNKWKFPYLKSLIFAAVIFFCLYPAPVSADIKASDSAFPALSPSEIISGINNYRLANGLNSLETNLILSMLAQGHAEYQASISNVTHTGLGGTTPKDRAYSAGYNGGNISYFAEIIYGGTNTTTSMAINWWKTSSTHNSMMKSSAFNEIGAGFATDGTWNYFTVEFGYSSGIEATSDGSNPEVTESPSSPVIPYAVPVIKATPREDGAVIHIIKTGQVPWTISYIYEIDLDVLLAQNGLTRYSYVYPGDEITIVPSNTPTTIPPTSTSTPTSTSIPTLTQTTEATATVEITATKLIKISPSIEVVEKSTATPIIIKTPINEPEQTSSGDSSVKWIILAAITIFFVLIVISMYNPQNKN